MNSKNVVNNIINEFNENINSHVFLIETNDVEKALIDIKSIIKAVIEADDTVSEQVDNDSYLELISVISEESDIKKDDILDLQKRLNTKPILSKFKFYIICPAEKLNINSANKLLKTIEEPEDGIIGFLITTNTDLIIDTIKSRCEEQMLIYDKEEDNNETEFTQIATEFIDALETKNLFVWHRIASKYSNLKDDGYAIAKEIKKIYTNAYIKPTTDFELLLKKKNSRKILCKKAELLNTYLSKLRENMNNVLLLDLLFIELKKVK